jgi:hypothetical protein
MVVGGKRNVPACLPTGRDPVPIAQEAGWAPGPIWTGAENIVSTGILSPHRPAHCKLLYRLHYPVPYSETKFEWCAWLYGARGGGGGGQSVSCYTKFIILSIDGRFVLLRRSPRLGGSLTSASIFLPLCCVAVTVLCTSKVCGSISDVIWPDVITDL